jgi:hypothetical protein
MHQVPAAIIDVVRMPEPDLPAVPDVFLFARVTKG